MGLVAVRLEAGAGGGWRGEAMFVSVVARGLPVSVPGVEWAGVCEQDAAGWRGMAVKTERPPDALHENRPPP